MQPLTADEPAAWIAAHPAEACTEVGHTEPKRRAGVGEWVLTLVVGLPIALVFGGLLAVALATP